MLLDLIFLIMLAYFGHKGYTKGAIVTFVTAVASLIGILMAITFSATVAQMLFESTDNVLLQKLMPVISYLLVFFGTVFLVKLLANFVKKTLKGMGLGAFDKLLGALISIATVLVITSLMYWVFASFGIFSQQIQETSKSFPILYAWAPSIIELFQMIFPFLKSSFAELKSYFDTLNASVSTQNVAFNR